MVTAQGEGLVFLLSLPRSGSTLLGLLLGGHPTILCPPEPWFLLKLQSLREPGWPDHPFDDCLASRGAHDFLSDTDFADAARAFAIVAYDLQLERAGKQIFVDKTPRYFHLLPFLDLLFPRARKVWLVRHPLDVAASYRETWGIDAEQLTGNPRTPAASDFAFGLFTLAEYFERSCPEKRVVRYESLVRSPRSALAELCDFIGVRFDEAMLAYAADTERIRRHASSIMGDRRALASQAPDGRSIGRWRTAPDVGAVQRMVDLIGGEIFPRLGYGETLEELRTLGIVLPDEGAAAAARRELAATQVDRVSELLGHIDALADALDTAEADRAARLVLIEQLRERLEQSQAERAVHLDAIERLHAELDARQQVISHLTEKLQGVLGTRGGE